MSEEWTGTPSRRTQVQTERKQASTKPWRKTWVIMIQSPADLEAIGQSSHQKGRQKMPYYNLERLQGQIIFAQRTLVQWVVLLGKHPRAKQTDRPPRVHHRESCQEKEWGCSWAEKDRSEPRGLSTSPVMLMFAQHIIFGVWCCSSTTSFRVDAVPKSALVRLQDVFTSSWHFPLYFNRAAAGHFTKDQSWR